MLSVGIKKELMFFTRSFRMWGILIAAIVIAVASPFLMKLTEFMFGVIDDSGIFDPDNTEAVVADVGEDYRVEEMSADITGGIGFEEMQDSKYLATAGCISALADLTSTLMLIIMLVTMYSAGGELKKRSMIIPQNAGLTPKLYVMPKFIVYPVIVGVIAFCGVWINYGASCILFPDNDISLTGVAVTSLVVFVFDIFMTCGYFALGLCTAKAGLSVIIMYGGNVIFSALFTALGADKFHPFTLVSQAQTALATGEVDSLNLWGSVGVTLLISLLCYFVTLFVISAKKIDNRGKQDMEL